MWSGGGSWREEEVEELGGVGRALAALLERLRNGGVPQTPSLPTVPNAPSLPSAGAPGADASGSVSQALDYLLGP